MDTGRARDISPNGEFDRKARIRSPGSVLLCEVNRGRIGPGQCIGEQPGIRDADPDAVRLTRPDCGHANGLRQVKGAKKVPAAADEVRFAGKVTGRVRGCKGWRDGIELTECTWNGSRGPVGRPYDLPGGGAIEMVNLPGHADGLSAVRNAESRFVRRFLDGGYGGKCREEVITSGIAADRQLQKRSPQRIGEQRPGPDCMGSLANRDPGIVPHVIGL